MSCVVSSGVLTDGSLSLTDVADSFPQVQKRMFRFAIKCLERLELRSNTVVCETNKRNESARLVGPVRQTGLRENGVNDLLFRQRQVLLKPAHHLFFHLR